MVDRLDRAYASCLRDARAHYENFPVASLLLPRVMRPHVAAVYAFARAADDFADEGRWTAAERSALLDGWHARLRDAARSDAEGPPARPGEPPHASEIFLALGASLRTVPLPLEPLEDLLSAFRQDVNVTRYARWDDLLDYCRRSANPVGRLVLRIAGYHDPHLDHASDALCSALQLTNFWQDVREDFARGRIYLPREEQRAHGAEEEDLAGGRTSPAWKHALAAAVARTRQLFLEGRSLGSSLSGRIGLEVRATWLGGMRILDRIERAHFDVIADRPTLGANDAWWIARHLLRGWM